ncbi:hypothetical protein ES708_11245 [subsurface metagenome]
MAHRAGQLDVPHALASYFGAGNLDAALIADNALVAYPLVLAAVTFEVLGGTEDTLAKKPVPLRFQGAVVDRLGLGDLAVRPASNLLRRSQRDTNSIEIVNFQHFPLLPLAQLYYL